MPLCVVGVWGGERERARHDGKGKERRELPPFPSSHRPTRAFYFSIIASFFLLEYPVEASVHVKERGKNLGLRTFW